MAYKTINPYTNEVVKEYSNTTDQELEEALQIGKDLYEKFKTQLVKERGKILHDVPLKFGSKLMN